MAIIMYVQRIVYLASQARYNDGVLAQNHANELRRPESRSSSEICTRFAVHHCENE